DGSTEPTATATINWVAGNVAALLIEPGNEGHWSNGQTTPIGGHATSPTATSGENEPVDWSTGKNITIYAHAVDSADNNVSGLTINFSVFHATPTNFENGTAGNSSCNPESEGPTSNHTTAGCTVTTHSAVTDSN